ncbi:putative transcriptional regulator [Methanomicrobium sp. W14]|uniref:winged helix-turn-helix transcriptional regulator n=1 Tax=Methanomicrobium sp. W14 TaxID=2817839 RepID=UPI001AE4F88B|nr:winged helix-turn-helix transcriptional regulator [Methanomicrobium sp. W14]MBP2132147.1 putative transcriptional regulator [Methanomicrobium sp. W14]
MKIKLKIFFFIFLTFALFVHAGLCSLSVNFGENSQKDNFEYNHGGDQINTFSDLPLWIQISWISSLIIGTAAAIKFLPVLTGKIRYALENTKRRKILEYIAENPGKCIEELSGEMNLNRETLRYHLICLERNNHIILESTDRSKRVFPNHNTFSGKQRKIISICHNPVQVKMLAMIAKYPGIRNSEIKDELDISKSAVSWHIKKLESSGVLSVRKSGKSGHYYIKSGFEKFVIENIPGDIKEKYEFERGDYT